MYVGQTRYAWPERGIRFSLLPLSYPCGVCQESKGLYIGHMIIYVPEFIKQSVFLFLFLFFAKGMVSLNPCQWEPG